MSSTSRQGRVTARELVARKARGERFVMVSVYDALFARLSEEAGVDVMLVGDSLGNVVAGLESTIPVTLDQMIYHAAAVKRGTARSIVVVDMPFLTYQASEEQALLNAGRVMRESGAQALKREGAGEEVLRAVRALTRAGVPVMGHIGFTPQMLHTIGGFRVQGREADGTERLVQEARALEAAGAFSVVLELVPADAARAVTAAVGIPTIGIGAGIGCDAQVLVLFDLLGLNDAFTPKFLKHYASLAGETRDAVRRFAEDVREGRYPDDAHSF